ncbi:hypothetical protein LCGC14_1191620 [marine sediment metagenome]|uniref:Uncharacterized protein n=2 Tax=root TaxID=1 RepID=A0A831QT72_9FLAO|nr:hypothetical protein [Pricia sp.]HEA22766.1 hypothetical protein [Pricia antarctica]
MEKQSSFTPEKFGELHLEQLKVFTENQKRDLKNDSPDMLTNFIERKDYLYQTIIEEYGIIIVKIINDYNLDTKSRLPINYTLVDITKFFNTVLLKNQLQCLRDFDSFSIELMKDRFDIK